jgi:Zn-dependent M28 family amino/carboxypeptidase
MAFFKCLILVIGSVSCIAQQSTTSNLETMVFQKNIVAKLTGEAPIDGKDTFLTQRASPDERTLTTDYLVAQLSSMGIKSEPQKYTTTNSNLFLDVFYAPVEGLNVIAELPATTSSSTYVILGAHYDTERTSPGAIDNATGIALILDVMQKLKLVESRDVNFLAVFFDQEEDDTVGSREFVKRLKDKERHVHSVHIFDLLGWDSNGNRKIALQSPPTFLEEAYRKNAAELDMLVEVIGGSSSDNRSFLKEGYDTVLFTDEVTDVTPYYHTSEDTMSTVNFDYLAQASKLVFKTLKEIAHEH